MCRFQTGFLHFLTRINIYTVVFSVIVTTIVIKYHGFTPIVFTKNKSRSLVLHLLRILRRIYDDFKSNDTFSTVSGYFCYKRFIELNLVQIKI